MEFVSVLLLFSFFFFFLLCETCRILAPRPGIKPLPSALEDRSLIALLSGNFLTNKQKKRKTVLGSQQEQREGTDIPHVFPAITHICLLPLLT